MIGSLDSNIPSGPLAAKWATHKDHARLVSPNNRRKFESLWLEAAWPADRPPPPWASLVTA